MAHCGLIPTHGSDNNQGGGDVSVAKHIHDGGLGTLYHQSPLAHLYSGENGLQINNVLQEFNKYKEKAIHKF